MIFNLANPASGGSSPWTLVYSDTVTVSTSSTQASSVATLSCGTGIWTKSKMIYVAIRDEAGPRNGYFLGSDTFFWNYQAANGSTSALTYAGRAIHRVSSSGSYSTYTAGSTAGYGVYAYSISSSGSLVIRARYSGNYSLTISGTYAVDVFALDYPDTALEPYTVIA